MEKELNKKFLFKSFRLLQQFSSVNRYSRDRLIYPENDMEHTGFVAMWCYYMAIDVKNLYNVDIDFGKLLRGAIVHDIDEVLTGDVPRPTKYYNKSINEAIKNLEKKSVKTIFNFLEHKTYYENVFEDWSNAKGNENIEQYIVKVADFMSVVYKVWLEVILLGNKSFIGVALEVLEVIQSIEHKETDDVNLYFVDIYRDAEEIITECVNSAEKVSHLVPRALQIDK